MLMKTKIPTTRVTKIAAARSQLETAITLWFNGGDPVSTHTLAWAAREIIRVLNSRLGSCPMLLDNDIIDPKYRKRYINALARPANFFKHGSRNGNDTIEFPHEITAGIILDACTMYRSLTQETVLLFTLFIVRMSQEFPQLFLQSFHDQFRELFPVEQFGSLTRDQFFQTFDNSITHKSDNVQQITEANTIRSAGLYGSIEHGVAQFRTLGESRSSFRPALLTSILQRRSYPNMKPETRYMHKVLVILAAVLLTSCSLEQYYPYEGTQKNWPVSQGTFADTGGGKIPVFLGFPPRPYILMGLLKTNFASDAPEWAKRNQWCYQARKFGADAVVILSQDQVYAGTIGGGSANTTATASGTAYGAANTTVLPGFPTTANTTGYVNSYASGQSTTFANSWSAPTYREHTTAWLIKWK